MYPYRVTLHFIGHKMTKQIMCATYPKKRLSAWFIIMLSFLNYQGSYEIISILNQWLLYSLVHFILLLNVPRLIISVIRSFYSYGYLHPIKSSVGHAGSKI